MSICMAFYYIFCNANDALAMCNKPSFKIAIDVGHTKLKPGAISARGIPEFIYNNQLAQAVEKKLLAKGFVKTRMIAIENSEHNLYDRINIINLIVPDILISIHHDSTQESFLSEWVFEDTVQKYSDTFEGWSIFVSSNNRHYDKSLKFAQYLGSALLDQHLVFSTYHSMNVKGERKKIIDRYRGIYNSTNLAILNNVETPAVLIEAGVIVNRKEETKINTRLFKEVFSNSISKSIEEFCNSDN